jgi:hypothetical protein
MRARKERRVAHAALQRLMITFTTEGEWTPACVDLFRVAVDCTKPRPWWRLW